MKVLSQLISKYRKKFLNDFSQQIPTENIKCSTPTSDLLQSPFQSKLSESGIHSQEKVHDNSTTDDSKEKHEEEIFALKREIDDKDSMIKCQNDEISMKSKEIKNQKKLTEVKDCEIRVLKNKMDELIKNSKTKTEEQDSDILDLKKNINKKDNFIKNEEKEKLKNLEKLTYFKKQLDEKKLRL